MKTLDEVLAAVTEADEVDDSLIALTSGLHQQVKDLLAGVTLPAGVQAKIDQVFENVTKGKEKVAAAVVANTDAAPEP